MPPANPKTFPTSANNAQPTPRPKPRPEPRPRDDDASARPLVFANGFALSPYAETGAPGGSLKTPPRTLWHASPGSSGRPTPRSEPAPGWLTSSYRF